MRNRWRTGRGSICGAIRRLHGLGIIAAELAAKAPGRHRLGALDGHLPLVSDFIPSQRLCTRGWKGISIRIATPSSTPTLALGLIWRSVVKAGQIHYPSVPPRILGESIWMALKLMGFQIHLRLENNKFGIKTLLVEAEEVILLKVVLKCIVVDIVLLLPMARPSIADMAALVPVTAVGVELIVPVESLTTKPTFRMASESTLINGSRNVISILLMLAQLCDGKDLVLMCKNFLVSCTQITISRSSVAMAAPRNGSVQIRTTSPFHACS